MTIPIDIRKAWALETKADFSSETAKTELLHSAWLISKSSPEDKVSNQYYALFGQETFAILGHVVESPETPQSHGCKSALLSF